MAIVSQSIEKHSLFFGQPQRVIYFRHAFLPLAARPCRPARSLSPYSRGPGCATGKQLRGAAALSRARGHDHAGKATAPGFDPYNLLYAEQANT